MLWNASKFGNENDVVRWYAAHRMNYMLKKGGGGRVGGNQCNKQQWWNWKNLLILSMVSSDIFLYSDMVSADISIFALVFSLIFIYFFSAVRFLSFIRYSIILALLQPSFSLNSTFRGAEIQEFHFFLPMPTPPIFCSHLLSYFYSAAKKKGN